jgi:hypothetical protein
MSSTVKVTQEHIDKGISGCPGLCPVAWAMRDVDMADPFVGSQGDIEWRDWETWKHHQCKAPDSVRNFVSNFDDPLRRSYCAPFTFELEEK